MITAIIEICRDMRFHWMINRSNSRSKMSVHLIFSKYKITKGELLGIRLNLLHGAKILHLTKFKIKMRYIRTYFIKCLQKISSHFKMENLSAYQVKKKELFWANLKKELDFTNIEIHMDVQIRQNLRALQAQPLWYPWSLGSFFSQVNMISL